MCWINTEVSARWDLAADWTGEWGRGRCARPRCQCERAAWPWQAWGAWGGGREFRCWGCVWQMCRRRWVLSFSLTGPCKPSMRGPAIPASLFSMEIGPQGSWLRTGSRTTSSSCPLCLSPDSTPRNWREYIPGRKMKGRDLCGKTFSLMYNKWPKFNVSPKWVRVGGIGYEG